MEHPIDQKFEFVGSAGGSRRGTPAGNDRLPMGQAKGDVRVADVEGKQHASIIPRPRPALSQPRPGARAPAPAGANPLGCKFRAYSVLVGAVRFDIGRGRLVGSSFRPLSADLLVRPGVAEVRSTGPSPAP